MQLDVVGFVDDAAAGTVPCRVEILGQSGLAVRHHRLAGEPAGVDQQPPAAPDDGTAVMLLAFAVHALAQAGVAQQVDAVRLQHAGADALQDIGAGAAFQHDAVHLVLVEDVRQQQPGRTSADDDDLGTHAILP